MLISYPASSLICISSCRRSLYSLEFPLYKIMSSANRGSFTYSFPFWCLFVSCLVWLHWLEPPVWSRAAVLVILVLFLISGENPPVFGHWDCKLWVFHKCPLSGWGSSLPFLVSRVFLSGRDVGFCPVLFLFPLRWSRGFLSLVLLVWFVLLIDFLMLNRSCFPGINSTWSWSVILLKCCVLFATVLLRVFASIFTRHMSIALYFSFNVFWGLLLLS